MTGKRGSVSSYLTPPWWTPADEWWRTQVLLASSTTTTFDGVHLVLRWFRRSWDGNHSSVGAFRTCSEREKRTAQARYIYEPDRHNRNRSVNSFGDAKISGDCVRVPSFYFVLLFNSFVVLFVCPSFFFLLLLLIGAHANMNDRIVRNPFRMEGWSCHTYRDVRKYPREDGRNLKKRIETGQNRMRRWFRSSAVARWRIVTSMTSKEPPAFLRVL